MTNKLLHIFIMMISLPGALQAQRQFISGRVVSESYAIKGVLVVNLRAEREVKTDSLGMFSLQAIEGDTLIITDPGIKPRTIIVDDDFLKESQVIIVEVNDVFQLEEAVIEKDNRLTSEALGLVPKNQKKYTSQERKLYTAGDFKAINLLGLLGGQLAIDPIINALNGRTKMLKKTVAIEKKENALELLDGMFTTEEISNNYKIPQEYVQGFFYYCVEDAEFSAAVKAKNNTLAKFLLNGLAINYLTLIKEIPDDK